MTCSKFHGESLCRWHSHHKIRESFFPLEIFLLYNNTYSGLTKLRLVSWLLHCSGPLASIFIFCISSTSAYISPPWATALMLVSTTPSVYMWEERKMLAPEVPTHGYTVTYIKFNYYGVYIAGCLEKIFAPFIPCSHG